MQLPDVNVLLYAARVDAPDHENYAMWLEDLLNGSEPYGISELVLSSFVRIATNQKAFQQPSTLDEALDFADQVREQPHCVLVQPGPRHWEIFRDLCQQVQAKGNLVPDAYLAALAIESGCEWISTDKDYARFPGLNWHHPFGAAP
jgi:toxin-antitoxin system PIN domain toxin